MKTLQTLTFLAVSLGLSATGAQAASLVATYGFNDTLAANEASAPALISIDPLGLNGFETASVNGKSQRVFRWSGDGSSPTLNAGLSLDTTGLIDYSNYSVEMTFEFKSRAAYGGGWRRVMDTQNRQSDNGFYVSPNNALQVYPVVTGSTTFTTPGFHNVVLTNFVVDGVREVKAYLDGNLELVSNTDQLNLNNPNNPGHLLHFFVDNLRGPAQLEFADGRIASLRLYNGIIKPSDPSSVSVPETGWASSLIVFGLGSLALLRRKVG
ncbi:PEP-CTERM sorting domain-containing protein [Oscillatoria sp. FACHB-1406]|uniref:PEP-CTERM sorting domain-containing protein n=1 Tax=Oscillatoria sp. FACHB-1406 TaxID=2692846 RepID=UPI0016834B42|nr:PEP-CTERM sorting domain-containing protein [Oscillatoria sp. FACHB-1406]MBD2576440.1 PEP-CTERM sorting domain-containing protein [Oscillatoria sp. FACHB-1406]